MEVKVRQKRIEEDRFLKMRGKVLSLWPTGKEVNLEEAIEYQKSMPESKRFSKVLEKLRIIRTDGTKRCLRQRSECFGPSGECRRSGRTLHWSRDYWPCHGNPKKVIVHLNLPRRP